MPASVHIIHFSSLMVKMVESFCLTVIASLRFFWPAAKLSDDAQSRKYARKQIGDSFPLRLRICRFVGLEAHQLCGVEYRFQIEAPTPPPYLSSPAPHSNATAFNILFSSISFPSIFLSNCVPSLGWITIMTKHNSYKSPYNTIMSSFFVLRRRMKIPEDVIIWIIRSPFHWDSGNHIY